jgi:hypothetical protein
VGLVLIGLAGRLENHIEITFLLGIFSCLIGIFFSFVAIFKREKGILKFVSLSSFFIALFLISWFEPFHFIRILIWLKNIA